MLSFARRLSVLGCLALIPAHAALAEDQGITPVAQPASDVAKPKLLGFLAPKDPSQIAERAERRAAARAERAARRALMQQATSAGQAQSASASDAARDEVKAAVAQAIANKPKGRIWCVPFARAVTGVEIRGNAKTWWDQAKGRYARAQEPRIGAVMAFAASRAMPKGHVAVVSKVLSDREILVDQANWERNQITFDTLVVDVSEKGDWSRVKVASASGVLGRVNPVNGFIYN
ncbi:CHAP domain-containing protein [Tabrizicola sp.]|uniref:CHAP domain-containing protein n=1 Tax=Tabrizicola sp. TaxID=2005166 RepID=UPI003D28502C